MKRIFRDIYLNVLIILTAVLFFQSSYKEELQTGNNHELNPYKVDTKGPRNIPGMKLVWNDEFNKNGNPNPDKWGFEYGFVRNRELQWYQPQNAYCKDGRLIIEGRKERVDNPNFNPMSEDWRFTTPQADYSSACIVTKGNYEWSSYGYYEIRARFDASDGAWPAIWLLGANDRWPYCGEIDLFEFYRLNKEPTVLANVVWGSDKQYSGNWNSSKKPLSEFLACDPNWINKFHIWSMKWDKDSIRLFIDDELINSTSLKETTNPDGGNPFSDNKWHYLLINLALGSNGGDPSLAKFPITFEIDYVRIYKDI